MRSSRSPRPPVRRRRPTRPPRPRPHRRGGSTCLEDDKHDNLRAALEHLTASRATPSGAADARRSACGGSGSMRGHLTRGPVPGRPGAGDGGAGRTVPTTSAAAAPSRLPAGLAYWAGDLGPPRACTTRRRSRSRAGWATTAEPGERAVQPVLRPPARPATPPSGSTCCEAATTSELLDEALDDLDAAGRRGGHGEGPVGPQRVVRLPGRLRPGGGSHATRALEQLRADRGPVLGELVAVHARVRAGCWPTTVAARRPTTSRRRCASSGPAATCPGLALVLSGIATLLLTDHRDADGYEVGGAVAAADRRDRAALGDAVAHGRHPDGRPRDRKRGPAGWRPSAGRACPEEAVERSLVLVDALAEGLPGVLRRRLERRTMAGVHASGSPARRPAGCPAPG